MPFSLILIINLHVFECANCIRAASLPTKPIIPPTKGEEMETGRPTHRALVTHRKESATGRPQAIYFYGRRRISVGRRQ